MSGCRPRRDAFEAGRCTVSQDESLAHLYVGLPCSMWALLCWAHVFNAALFLPGLCFSGPGSLFLPGLCFCHFVSFFLPERPRRGLWFIMIWFIPVASYQSGLRQPAAVHSLNSRNIEYCRVSNIEYSCILLRFKYCHIDGRIFPKYC